MNALHALGRGFLDLFRLKIILLLFVPPVLSFLFWAGLAYSFWTEILSFSQAYSDRFLFSAEIPQWILQWLEVTPVGVATALAATVAVLLIIPLGLVTAMALTSMMAMPVVLSLMGERFGNMERKGRVYFSSTLKNIFFSSFIYLFLWALTLPLWLVPGLGFALPLILNGYLNYRLFTFDALADYADKNEIETLMKEYRLDFLLLGVVLSIPLLFLVFYFITPVYSALVFSRYSLMKLEQQRLRAL